MRYGARLSEGQERGMGQKYTKMQGKIEISKFLFQDFRKK